MERYEGEEAALHIDLIDRLRCPGEHEESWLVAAAVETRGRHIVRGTLGCPVCRREFSIERGQCLFVSAGVQAKGRFPGPSLAEIERIQALLDLTQAGGVVGLVGDAAPLGPRLEEESDVAALLLNPTYDEDCSTIVFDKILPLAQHSLRGVVVGGDTSLAVAEAVVRSVKARGRVVGLGEAPIPAGVRELARDAKGWVGVWEGSGASAPVSITRSLGRS